MPKFIRRIANISTLLLTASACGGGGATGGGGFVGSTPTPTPTPAPTTTLQTPAQTPPGMSSSAVPIAGLSTATNLPLLTTAVTGNFSGDPVVTSAGGVLQVGSGAPKLSLYHAPLGVSLQPEASNVALSDGRRFSLAVEGDALDYTRFGSWYIYSYSPGGAAFLNGGSYVGGFVTPGANLPVVGTASYSGIMRGLYSEYHLCSCASMALVNGNVQLSANFAARSLAGSMTNFTIGSDTFTPGPLNDIGFNGTWTSGSVHFSGTTFVNNAPGGSWAFTPGASGQIAGAFFGPSAQEIGATFTLSDGVRRMIGSFGAKQ